jgi:four helix bundle protein
MATYSLPHHKLIAFEVAKELLVAVRETHVRDASLRDQALRAAKSACLNISEGAGRASKADKARVYAIARAEAGEAAAAIEIAVLSGDADEGSLDRAMSSANRLIALLTGLIRR